MAADIELIDLMLKSVAIGDVGEVLLSLGHIGVFRALAEAAGLTQEQAAQLLALMQDKDAAAVSAQVGAWKLDGMWAKAFALLPTLYGSRDVLAEARAKLPDLFAVGKALNELQAVCDAFPQQAVHIDLSELRVDNYHTGLLYAAYGKDNHEAVARGGRYDGLGEYFGRARPATGFSFDLRTFIGRLPQCEQQPPVAVAAADLPQAQETVNRLRAEGQAVVIDYGAGQNGVRKATRRLQRQGDGWQVVETEV